MNLDAGTKTRILLDVTVGLDPTGSTVELRVDDTWYPATWIGTPAASGEKWTQTARTVAYFAGPDANASGAVALTAGRHVLEVRVTSGQDVLTVNLSSLTIN